MLDKDILVLDVETTGLDPLVHQVIEVGAVRLDRNTLAVKRKFSSLLRPLPGTLSDPESMVIHKIPDEQLIFAPYSLSVLLELSPMVADCYIAGWNVGWDVQMLRALWAKVVRAFPPWPGDYHLLDIWSLYKAQFPGGGNHLLDAARVVGIEVVGVAHRALPDVELESLMLQKLLTIRHWEAYANSAQCDIPYRPEPLDRKE